MKKFIFLILPLTILVSCGMFKSITVEDLRIGMSKEDVRQMYGPPKKILSVSQTDFGLQEILEYKTVNSELYTLEFMDNRLVSYGYIGDDINYVPPPAQPVVIVEPVYPLPPPPPPAIHPAPRPPRPERPRPPQTQPRPETKPQRPSNTTPSHRPIESAPSRPSAPREPENSTRPGKPSESTRTSGRTESTGSNRSSGESNRQTVKQEPSRSSSNSSGGGRR